MVILFRCPVPKELSKTWTCWSEPWSFHWPCDILSVQLRKREFCREIMKMNMDTTKEAGKKNQWGRISKNRLRVVDQVLPSDLFGCFKSPFHGLYKWPPFGWSVHVTWIDEASASWSWMLVELLKLFRKNEARKRWRKSVCLFAPKGEDLTNFCLDSFWGAVKNNKKTCGFAWIRYVWTWNYQTTSITSQAEATQIKNSREVTAPLAKFYCS